MKFTNVASNLRQKTVYTGRVLLTTSGTISASTPVVPGLTITKAGSEAGRYLFTLTGRPAGSATYHITATVIGPDDTAMTAGGGIVAVARSPLLNSTGTVLLQFVRPDTYVDAEVQDNASFTFELTVNESGVL